MFELTCVATAQPPSQASQNNLGQQARGGQPSSSGRFFRSVQWSADGTCLITSSADNSIQTFVLPPTLLEDAVQPDVLEPYCSITARDPVSAIVGYPRFDLAEPNTTLVLSSLRDHPIRLHSALTGYLGATYALVHPTTEAFISPHALAFSPHGDRFVAGSDSLISVFDVARPGAAPVSSVATGPKRKTVQEYNGAQNMRGIVSALAIEPATGVLAAGTFGRHVGLYEAMGQGSCQGVFSVQGTAADGQIGGGGVTQLWWSPCGRYLYVCERRSGGVVVYDIRKTGQLLAWLRGRVAETNQRLAVDLAITGPDDREKHEIWAGGVDGGVRMWKNPHHAEGAVEPTFNFQPHDDAVSATTMHRSGGVLATASGQRHLEHGAWDSPTPATIDNSLKIWGVSWSQD